MFEHLQSSTIPSRVVVLGAAGFVGQTLCRHLKDAGINYLGLTRQILNLLDPQASQQLIQYLQPDDTLVVISAEAPCKNAAMLCRNIGMIQTVCEALQKQTVQQVVYVSSDAVYADSDAPITEASPTAPTALHGVMHLAREMMLQSIATVNMPLAILRCSLLYGIEDPHNGYGPNRFRRLATDQQPIILFGEGEEQRDHVYIEDVAELMIQVILRRSQGVLNIATGQVTSFRQIAEKIRHLVNPNVVIQATPRVGVMPHNGYRAFDTVICHQAFPDFTYTSIDEGLALVNELQNA